MRSDCCELRSQWPASACTVWAVGSPASLYHLSRVCGLCVPVPLPLSQKRFLPGVSRNQTGFLSASRKRCSGSVGLDEPPARRHR